MPTTKLLLSAALLALAGTSSAFNGATNTGVVPANSDISGIPIVTSVIGGAPNPGAFVDASTPGASLRDAGITMIDKRGSSLVVTINATAFPVVSSSLAGLGTVDSRGNIVVTGAGLNTLARNVGVDPADLTAERLIISQPREQAQLDMSRVVMQGTGSVMIYTPPARPAQSFINVGGGPAVTATPPPGR